MDDQHRLGENGDVPYRTSRFFSVGEKWFFSTREGFNSGPYATFNRAENSLERFKQVAQKLTNH